MDAVELRRLTDKLVADREHAVRSLKDEEEALAAAEAKLAAVERARAIILEVAQGVQQKVHGRVAAIVGKCLRAVFDDPYDFDILFERKRGRTEARMVFKKRGREVDPEEAGGGGVIDVAAFALRVACLVMTRPALRPVLVMDEPFKHLNGAAYQERAAGIVRQLADDMKLQIIMAADDDWLKDVGKTIEL